MRAYINTIVFIAEIFLGIVLVTNQTLYQTICDYFQVENATMWIGFMTSSFFIGLVVSALVSGELAEHIGKKNVIAIFSFFVLAGDLLLVISNSPEMALICIIILGLGFGGVEGLVNGIVVDENETGSSRILNFSNIFFSIGAILSPFFISNYIVSGGDWRTVYIIAGIMFASLAVLFLIARPKTKPAMKKKKGIAVVGLMKRRLFLIPCLMIFVYIGAENAATAWNVNVFDSTVFGAWALSVFWAAMGISRFLAGFVKPESLQRFLIYIFIFAIAGFLGIILFNQYEIPALICFFLVGIGLGPQWPSYFSMGLDNAGEFSGAGSGGIMFFSSLGGVALCMVLGALSGFSIMIAGIVFIAVIFLLQRIYIRSGGR